MRFETCSLVICINVDQVVLVALILAASLIVVYLARHVQCFGIDLVLILLVKHQIIVLVVSHLK